MSAWSAIGKVAGVVAFPVVFGGCCGTDHRHLAEISRQVAA